MVRRRFWRRRASEETRRERGRGTTVDDAGRRPRVARAACKETVARKSERIDQVCRIIQHIGVPVVALGIADVASHRVGRGEASEAGVVIPSPRSSNQPNGTFARESTLGSTLTRPSAISLLIKT
jgi:hypothetical protein